MSRFALFCEICGSDMPQNPKMDYTMLDLNLKRFGKGICDKCVKAIAEKRRIQVLTEEMAKAKG